MVQFAFLVIGGVLGLLPSSFTSNEICSMKIDFKSSEETELWEAVNDGVMGGLSSGGPEFDNGRMVFSGVLNTNGGGFSSIRRSIDPGSLEGVPGILMRVKPDNRNYRITLRTDATDRGQKISFQAPIPATAPGSWADVFVSFDTISPSVFGRLVHGVEFDETAATSVGIIIADKKNGPFRLEIDSIESC